MKYVVLTEDGTCWEGDFDSLPEALALFMALAPRQRTVLVHTLLDSAGGGESWASVLLACAKKEVVK